MRVVAALLAALVLVPAAAASQPLGDLNVTGLTLAVNTTWHALLSYRREDGRPRAMCSPGRDQRPTAVAERAAGRVPASTTPAGCAASAAAPPRGSSTAARPTTDRRSPFLVAACKAPDGTYWAVQAWQRLLPMRGFAPWLPDQGKLEFHVSHWSGPLALLEVSQNWTYGGRWQGLFGRLSYDGQRGVRVQDAVGNEARRRLCALRLHRRTRLRLRSGLAARRGQGAAPRERRVLLQLRPAGAAPWLPDRSPRGPAIGDLAPGDGDGAGRDTGRAVGRAVARRLTTRRATPGTTRSSIVSSVRTTRSARTSVSRGLSSSIAPMARTIAAALTPLRPGGAEPDLGALEPYLAFLAARGVDGVLLLGTTGEGCRPRSRTNAPALELLRYRRSRCSRTAARRPRRTRPRSPHTRRRPARPAWP